MRTVFRHVLVCSLVLIFTLQPISNSFWGLISNSGCSSIHSIRYPRWQYVVSVVSVSIISAVHLFEFVPQVQNQISMHAGDSTKCSELLIKLGCPADDCSDAKVKVGSGIGTPSSSDDTTRGVLLVRWEILLGALNVDRPCWCWWVCVMILVRAIFKVLLAYQTGWGSCFGWIFSQHQVHSDLVWSGGRLRRIGRLRWRLNLLTKNDLSLFSKGIFSRWNGRKGESCD